jgi:tetrahydromethanopterin S-methyltransferase subunit B
MKHVIFAVFLITALYCTYKQTRYAKLRKGTQGDFDLWEAYSYRETKYRFAGMVTALVTGFMGGQLYL